MPEALSYIDYGLEENLTTDQADGLFESVTLQFLSTTHVEVITTIADVATTLDTSDFTVTGDSGSSTVTITSTAVTDLLLTTGGTFVRITRTTPIDELQRTFTDGSVLKSSDLNAQNQQLLFRLQEQTDSGVGSLPIDTDNKYDAGGKTIKNLPSPGNDDEAVTRGYISNIQLHGTAFGGTDPQYWPFNGDDGTVVGDDRVFTFTTPIPASQVDNMYLVELGGVIQDPATYTVYTEGASYKLRITGGATSIADEDEFFVRNFGVARNVIEQPFTNLDDDTIALQIKRYSSGTTADLQQWQTETGTMLGKVEADGDATFKDLTVGAIAGTGAITGVTSITGTGDISGANILGANITGTGNAAIDGTLASGAATISGDTTVDGTLQTTGEISSTGGGIDVTGDGVIDGNLGVGTGASPTGIGDISATGDINATGNITGTNLKGTGTVIIDPTLGITAGTDDYQTNFGKITIDSLGPSMEYKTASETGPQIKCLSASVQLNEGSSGGCKLDMNNFAIAELKYPEFEFDAATKGYVDSATGGGGSSSVLCKGMMAGHGYLRRDGKFVTTGIARNLGISITMASSSVSYTAAFTHSLSTTHGITDYIGQFNMRLIMQEDSSTRYVAALTGYSEASAQYDIQSADGYTVKIGWDGEGTGSTTDTLYVMYNFAVYA
jgi:hypothetical protein